MKVRFKIESQPVPNYDKTAFVKKLRDKISKNLVPLCREKFHYDNSNEYIVTILEYIYYLEVNSKQLRNIETFKEKFNFLQYQTFTDKLIHGLCWEIIALCNKDKKRIELAITPWHILDSRYEYLNHNGEGYVGWDKAQALCKDVAEFTRKAVGELLEELRTTGKIMTSEELAERNRRELELSSTDEEDDYSDDKFEDESEDDTKQSSSGNNNQDTNQRSVSFQESKEENNKDRTISNDSKIKVDDANSLLNPALKKLLSWINDLPEWLQKQILSSSAVIAVIESIERNAKIYDKKVDLDIYQQDKFSSEEDSFSYIDDKIDQKVTFSEVLSSEFVDTNMILDGTYVSGLILPTSGEQAINFNGLNFYDLALF